MSSQGMTGSENTGKCSDIYADEIKKLGIMSVPYMQINDGELMDFATAINWINGQADTSECASCNL